MSLTWLLVGFFIFVTMVFLAVAFLFPEWVGITGKKAKEIQKHQQGDSELNSQESPKT
jgi:hypothetical protein